MKLYFAPGACSLSIHISLREAGLDFELDRVHLGSKKTSTGADFKAINPKGYVPALEIQPGLVLTEGPAILQWIADQKPEAHLTPEAGSFERYRHLEWLTFISSELHKQFSPLFDGKMPEEVKERQRHKIAGRLDFVEEKLAGKGYLMGDAYMAADGYLFTVLRWTKSTGIDLARWPGIVAFMARMHERPAVKASLEAEAQK